jgi:hypothetical protein
MPSPTVRMMMAALAISASFLTYSITQPAARAPTVSNEKKVIFADGSEPMPACRKKVCPPEGSD